MVCNCEVGSDGTLYEWAGMWLVSMVFWQNVAWRCVKDFTDIFLVYFSVGVEKDQLGDFSFYE